MGYKKGAEWEGNRNGRPKLPDFRAQFTQELLKANFDDAKHIVGSLVSYCKNGDQWALKLYCSTVLPYMLIKPKAEIDISSYALSEGQEAYANLPSETLDLIAPHMEAIKKIMKGSNK